MTERLYYHDAYRVEFQAQVVERLSDNGRYGLVLDRSLFYPTSGGQPFDRGTIDGISVEEVLVRESDGALIHWLAAEPVAVKVSAEVDWARRFDHMQQHTGQHILSQAFERIAGAATVGFHMSAETSSIDLDIDSDRLNLELIAQAELLANQVVWDNRAVDVRFVSPADASHLPLRKLPPARNGLLRLVEISDFDLSACGGTHVRQTGEIGLIKVTRSERQAGNARLEFLCGRRALNDYQDKNTVLAQLSTEMTTGYWEIEGAISRLRADLKDANRALKRKSEELIQIEAQALISDAVDFNGVRIITRLFTNRDFAEMRRLAGRLVTSENAVVLFGLAGPKAQLLFARSDNLSLAVNELLGSILPVLGNATGGGSPKFAQGGGPPAGESQVELALAAAERWVREAIAAPQS